MKYVVHVTLKLLPWGCFPPWLMWVWLSSGWANRLVWHCYHMVLMGLIYLWKKLLGARLYVSPLNCHELLITNTHVVFEGWMFEGKSPCIEPWNIPYAQ